MDDRRLALQEVRTAAGLTAELRELKARSRLTYRQLEERAAGNGEPLPRSTLADVLRNGSLPRQELLAAFVRACGEGAYVDEWLAARRRAAEDPDPVPAPGGPNGPGGPGGPGGSRGSGGPGGRVPGRAGRDPRAGALRRLAGSRRVLAGAGVLLAAALITAGARALWDGDGAHPGKGPAGHPAASRPGLGATAPLPRGRVQLRPLGSPGLCVTDGTVADGRYGSLVAVQRPCAETAPQTTTLDPAGGGAYRISWYRPSMGKGCLRMLADGSGEGLLEPRGDCGQGTVFRFVPAEPRTARAGAAQGSRGRTYLIKISDGTCVGIRDGSTAEGTEAVAEACTGADAQLFVVRAAP
ncbi:XRE family transcriptional regulator [Streptomyces sp. NPDC006193]|uniref:XRE family transcriptional regulator n=1 Tax=Streptomyces sp. NPDC006193 TaxID=3155717 RepID=UPI0033A7171B